jgi:hypothetical protein
MRKPSPLARGLPSRTIEMAMKHLQLNFMTDSDMASVQ